MSSTPLVFQQKVMINAPASRIWRAITTPAEVAAYYLCPLETIELRSGGRIIYASGETRFISGTVMEVVPERRLVHTFRFDVATHKGIENDAESRVTYAIEPTETGCELALTHDDFGSDNQTHINVSGGWPMILGGLKRYLENEPATKPHITATLSVRNWDAAFEFYKKAFGATELYRVPGGGVGQLAVGKADFWVAEESPEHLNFSPESIGGCSVRMLLMVEDPAKMCTQAVAAGARQVVPVSDNHGWRLGRILDPFGHHWEIARRV